MLHVTYLQEFGDQATWAQELLYCDSMLQKDVRNNSAWNQRAFIIRLQLQAAQGVPSTSNADMDPVLKHVLLHELEYAAAHAIRAPRNESVWNYVMGLFKLPGVPPHAMGRFEMVSEGPEVSTIVP
jgi:protein farnesyltransferase/geranylgeranyltransferase type-1 subunit alpha